MSDYTASDLLRKAAERTVEPGKWYQGGFYKTGPLDEVFIGESIGEAMVRLDLPGCALGQLFYAVKALGDHRLRLFAEVALQELLTVPVATWNDAPGRTAADVAAKMREAADRLDGIIE